jgi:ATP-dependent RNA helicase RhlE
MNAQAQATEIATGISFDSLPLAPFLKETIRTVGYTTPTPIQADAIPVIIEGQDVIGLAQTGTGKTAAFVLPLLQKLSGSKERGVRALILAPTRELAEQIHDVLKTFSGRTGIKSVTVYGGVSHRNQITQLRNNPQIIVACPGRLMDHIRGKTVNLSGVQYLILDEADRMLDMGFMPDIKAIIKELPGERQTMLFSATMPDEIADLSKTVLNNPTTIRVKSEQPVAAISHSMYSVTQEGKGDTLTTWLQANTQALTVVFTKMKHTAKRLGDRLTKAGVPATSLHGNLSQAQRQKALQGFRDGRYRVLIATDIASRGIDVEGVTHVVNYDMPDTLEAYIHRTGRAGRASRQGDAVSFVTRADRGMVRSIEQWLKTPLNRLNTEGAFGAEGSAENEDSPRQERRGRSPRRGNDRRGGGEGRFSRGRGERRDREAGANSDVRQPRERRERGPKRFGTFADAPREGSFERRERRSERSDDRRNVRSDDRRGGRFDDRRGARSDERRGGRPEDRQGGENRRSFRRDGEDRPRQSFSENRRDGSRSYGRQEGERSTFDRPFKRNDGRGGGQRSGARKPFGARPERSGMRKGGEGAAKPARAFRGQQDIDQSADYVYRESKQYFIDRGVDPEARKPRGFRPNKPGMRRGSKPRN